MAPGCESSRHLFQIQVDGRDEVMAALNTAGIFPGVHYRDNMLYRMFRDGPPCPSARLASGRLMSLPMHMRLSYKDVCRVSSTLLEVLQQMRKFQRGMKSA